MTTSRKLLAGAVAVSAVAHLTVYVLLGRTWWTPSPAPGPAGTVSIAFVEPVVHAPAAPVAPSRGRPRKTTPAEAPRADAPARPPPAAGAEGHAGPAADEVGRFVAQISRAIDARKVYPRPALSRELEGRVVVAITLDVKGTLVESGVEEPCPFAMLNDAALAAVRGVGRYPPLPAHAGPTLHLHVPILFTIKR